MAIFNFGRDKTQLPSVDEALPGRSSPLNVEKVHYVNGESIYPPFDEGTHTAVFGMGCFWGVERKFWQVPGVVVTAVGYSAGLTPNPTYEEVCTGLTGHNEVVLVVYDPNQVSYQQLLQVFFENHDPTQGMRQGNDVGTQYRSGIYVNSLEQEKTAKAMKTVYAQRLHKAGLGEITTEIKPVGDFYYAETYHQQYLAKNPNGYCGVGGTGVSCPVGVL